MITKVKHSNANVLDIAFSKLSCKFGIVEVNFIAMTSSIQMLAHPADEIKTIETSAQYGQDCFYSTHNYAPAAKVRTKLSRQHFYSTSPFTLMRNGCHVFALMVADNNLERRKGNV